LRTGRRDFEQFWPVVWPQVNNKILIYLFFKVKDFVSEVAEANKLEPILQCIVFFLLFLKRKNRQRQDKDGTNMDRDKIEGL
jgi:hypothetical protein